MRLEDRDRLLGQGGVLEPRVRQPLRDPAVQHRVGRRVDDGAAVVALEVDRVDGPGRRELRDELVGPLRIGVELEAEVRVELEPRVHALGQGRVSEPHRDDERHRPRLAAERVSERPAGLPQR